MIDIAWSEFLLVFLVAIIFLGPKELISLMKTVGSFVGKAQSTMQHVKMLFEHEVYKQEQFDKHKDDKDI
jgi:sec-independent protein translocase protein TatB